MNFELDPLHFSSVTITKRGNCYRDKENPTADDLIELLKGKGDWSSTSSIDHPEFTKLREQLGQQEYIKIERMWWNGDRVLKPFTLNGAEFEIDEKFPCAGAMSGHMKFTKKVNR